MAGRQASAAFGCARDFVAARSKGLQERGGPVGGVYISSRALLEPKRKGETVKEIVPGQTADYVREKLIFALKGFIGTNPQFSF